MKSKIQQGWECPKCGNVYNPSVKECVNCINTSIPLDFDRYNQKLFMHSYFCTNCGVYHNRNYTCYGHNTHA